MRFLLKGILTVFVLLALSYGYLVWNNNLEVAPPNPDELHTTLENSIQWLIEHREIILDKNNEVLWHMLKKASDSSGDTRLKELFTDYSQRYLDKRPNNVWRPLFHPKSWVPVRFENISNFPYYNWHYIYASTCDQELEKVPEIAAQNNPAFCDRHPLRPACVTHQMMGLLLLKRSKCGDQAELDSSIKILQQRVHTQLTWDPRVIDVYMQRVLMLVESGAGDLVKPVWLQQLIDAQQTDGGWGSFMPLIPVGGNFSIGTGRLPSIETPKSNFHTTAQGVLLFALLTQPKQ